MRAIPAALSIRKYEGTRLGRQELNAEILDDVPGALWNRLRLEDARWPTHRAVPELSRIVIAIDPAATSGEEADETGIIVAGKDGDGRGFVHEDRSGRYQPIEWARLAISLTTTAAALCVERRLRLEMPAHRRRFGRGATRRQESLPLIE